MAANGPYCHLDISGSIQTGPNTINLSTHLEGEACQVALDSASKPQKAAKAPDLGGASCKVSINGSSDDGNGTAKEFKTTLTGSPCNNAMGRLIQLKH